ncbi:MAG: tyrosine-type recombinase/integrase [Chloroflexi bacterium]|nr:tyrosine-type recombinase/integrase [Chloroflexota bacterium]
MPGDIQLIPLPTCLDMFLLHQEASHHTRRTIEFYRYNLSRFLAFLEDQGVQHPQAITPHHIRQFLVTLERRGLKDTTVHSFARPIKTFLNFLVSEGILEASPMHKVSMPRLEQRIHPPFSEDDIRKLLAACGQDWYGLRDKAIILCLLDTGLRAAEFVNLNVGDIDGDGTITVHGKGGKDRYVHVGALARKALVRYLATRGHLLPHAPMWIGRTGKRLTVSGLFQAMRRRGRQAGVWPVGPHRFRRTFAIWALRNGMDVHHLRAILGHADLQMAQRYLALAKDDLIEAHRLASPVDNMR